MCLLPIVQKGYNEISLLISKDSKTLACFLICPLIFLELLIPAINKTVVVVKMLLLWSFKSAVCGSTGAPSTSRALLSCLAAHSVTMLPCCSFLPPIPTPSPWAVTAVSWTLSRGHFTGLWLLTLQVPQQFFTCALLHAPLFLTG